MMEETDEDRLRLQEGYAETAYSAMYDARDNSAATAHYSNAKEALYTAIGLAKKLGKLQLAERLSKRLAHIKAVFRSQFS
jgi:hypothetical protein